MVAVASSSTLRLSDSPAPAPRRRWKPDGDAHLIFRWVKMEGKSQSWVASAFGIHQSTVSRIVQRYERWQAHAKEREDGRLDHSERLRAARWLTYERNELILTSCLRIAHEIEGFIDTSRSTIRRPTSNPNQESEIRTEHAAIDRTGMTARFLRLAFKINMEQLALAELAQPPEAQPLTDEELAEEERQAAADAAELAAARRRVGSAHQDRPDDANPEAPLTAAEAPSPAEPRDAEREEERSHAERGNEDAKGAASVGEAHPTTACVHNLHNANDAQIVASSAKPCSCKQPPRQQKNSADCITDFSPPPSDRWPVQSADVQATAATG